jgi:multidrug resistance efflux pump
MVPTERVIVRAELAGVLTQILVDEGQPVKRGQVIARLDDRALRAERLKLLAELTRLDAQLASLRQGRRAEELAQQRAVVAARRSEAGFAAKQARRGEELASQGVGSREAAEAARRELDARGRAVAEAEAALRLLEAGSRPELIAAQQAVRARASAELAALDEQLAMTVIVAPIDGEIVTPRLRERVAEGVVAGGVICEIVDARRMRAEILVPEAELDSIAVGMPTVIKVASYPDDRYVGAVELVAPAVVGAPSDRRLRVRVTLVNRGGVLKPQMTGYAEIEAGDRSLLHLATRRIVRWMRVRFFL